MPFFNGSMPCNFHFLRVGTIRNICWLLVIQCTSRIGRRPLQSQSTWISFNSVFYGDWICFSWRTSAYPAYLLIPINKHWTTDCELHLLRPNIDPEILFQVPRRTLANVSSIKPNPLPHFSDVSGPPNPPIKFRFCPYRMRPGRSLLIICMSIDAEYTHELILCQG